MTIRLSANNPPAKNIIDNMMAVYKPTTPATISKTGVSKTTTATASEIVRLLFLLEGLRNCSTTQDREKMTAMDGSKLIPCWGVSESKVFRFIQSPLVNIDHRAYMTTIVAKIARMLETSTFGIWNCSNIPVEPIAKNAKRIPMIREPPLLLCSPLATLNRIVKAIANNKPIVITVLCANSWEKKPANDMPNGVKNTTMRDIDNDNIILILLDVFELPKTFVLSNRAKNMEKIIKNGRTTSKRAFCNAMFWNIAI